MRCGQGPLWLCFIIILTADQTNDAAFFARGAERNPPGSGLGMGRNVWEPRSHFAEKLRGIRNQHGHDSIGVLTSAKCLNEENFLITVRPRWSGRKHRSLRRL